MAHDLGMGWGLVSWLTVWGGAGQVAHGLPSPCEQNHTRVKTLPSFILRIWSVNIICEMLKTVLNLIFFFNS